MTECILEGCQRHQVRERGDCLGPKDTNVDPEASVPADVADLASSWYEGILVHSLGVAGKLAIGQDNEE